MQSTQFPFSPVKDGRRILGEKNTNACLSPANRPKDSFSATGTPTKRVSTVASPKKLLPSPIFAGAKRTRDQVDETDVNSGHVKRHSPELSPTPEENSTQSILRNGLEDQSALIPDAMDTGASTPQHTQLEHDEPDHLHAENVSATADNSQQPTTRAIPNDPETRKMFIQEVSQVYIATQKQTTYTNTFSPTKKAQLLRSRLQSAMRNVADHQFDRRVSELEAHSRKCPRLSLSALATPSMFSKRASTPSQTKTPQIVSVGTRLSLSNTPDLPAAQPSSAIAVRDATHDVRAKTPTRENNTPSRALGSPMQLSSPPATVGRRNRNEDGSDEPRVETRGGMSPSERGDAVDGLLKLMHTDRHDNADAWTA
ncbi:hypothetical protein N7474_004106 [Penicillium riverlandense]|uniref:uncharacterized protein n=1 Tax=Penicillium riverlandense TaxID=1903569 RepID=UPI002549B6F4|nr:uncharacterized protein N7474_004106 [Penicillium riverlandense]KAJ5818515.1 hypothetical protein N7474_004106 [Penicillium riverlandense]